MGKVSDVKAFITCGTTEQLGDVLGVLRGDIESLNNGEMAMNEYTNAGMGIGFDERGRR